jgi:hypothetical protein
MWNGSSCGWGSLMTFMGVWQLEKTSFWSTRQNIFLFNTFFCFYNIMRTALSQIAHIDEILDRIFVHLDTPTLVHRIQLVNKQWNRVAEQHIVYTQKAI